MPLKWLFGRSAKAFKTDPPPDYEEAKAIAAGGDASRKAALARNTGLQPELLYFFASDQDPEVRRTVARNPRTPVQADVLLSKDSDTEVKVALGEKIGRLLPDLSDETNQKLIDMVLEVVDALATDTQTQVRAAIAQQIRAADTIPPRIAKRLAQDAEAIVSAPVLAFSPLLNDDDLLAIIAAGCAGEPLSAISNRATLSAAVSRAVAETRDDQAVATLLRNRGAAFDDALLEEIVADSAAKTAWQAALIDRPDLTGDLMRRMASYLNAVMLERLIKNNVLIDETLAAELRRRSAETIDPPEATPPEEGGGPSAGDADEKRARALFDAKKLDVDLMTRAARNRETEFLIHALALLADAATQDVRRLLAGDDPRLTVSLAWRCNLGMAFATALHEHVVTVKGAIKPSKGENAPGYPMSEDDMCWVLEVAGII